MGIVKEAARLILRRPVIGAAIVARVPDGRWLLIRRADTGEWALPGGTLEWGETIRELIPRELREEAGTEVRSIGRLVGVFSRPSRDPALSRRDRRRLLRRRASLAPAAEFPRESRRWGSSPTPSCRRTSAWGRATCCARRGSRTSPSSSSYPPIARIETRAALSSVHPFHTLPSGFSFQASSMAATMRSALAAVCARPWRSRRRRSRGTGAASRRPRRAGDRTTRRTCRWCR